ncbi:tetratricopeptide repeat protein [Saccharibacter sp. 17.LH.SD]|uniref:tetratricopeptide repeat protein n=1 Tax=Saccharibacter sp. 17.LH.SD TaxID=2689393 RepID=UPI00136A42AC|nr:tetratricopeptide repeat protein [Saccharibacter sp. 17.LH.SD]MXV44140.1 tetratricopeptide repeat protein [Saccharibacter sp. 17.LH.SD]
MMESREIDEAYSAFQKGDFLKAEQAARFLIQTTGVMHPEAVHILASIALHRQQSATAVALIGRVLKEKEASRSATVEGRLYQTLGRALLAEGQAEAARASFSIAVSLFPEEAASHAGLGETLLQLNRSHDAVVALRQAVTLAPRQPSFWYFLAQAQQKAGAVADAEYSWRQLVTLCPQDGAVYANHGACLFELRRVEAASKALEQALALGCHTARTYNNLALVRNAQGTMQEARDLFQKAYQRAPGDRDIYINYAAALFEMGEVAESAAWLEKLSQGHLEGVEYARVRLNEAALSLARNEWEKGWEAFEARRTLLPPMVTTPLPEVPLWEGEEGKEPIAVYGEQGVGDVLQFLRFLPDIMKKRPVRLDVSADILSFVKERMTLPEGRLCEAHDNVVAQQSLLSMPYVLKRYCAPDPQPYCRNLVQSEKGLIGLCWAGNPAYAFDRRRSIPVQLLEPFRCLSDVRFLSLQQHQVAPDWMEKAPLSTLRDVAYAVDRCSLIVSVDSFVGHLAGALGRPLWLLNRKGGDWRWQGMPWYENVRMFQATAATPPYESWPDVIHRVVHALEKAITEIEDPIL